MQVVVADFAKKIPRHRMNAGELVLSALFALSEHFAHFQFEIREYRGLDFAFFFGK